MDISIPLNWLFNKLNSTGIKYCVLHSFEQLPKYSDSDVDIVIDKKYLNKIPELLYELEKKTKWKVVQKIKHEYNSEYYVLYNSEDSHINYLQLDFCTDYVRDKRICIKNNELLENRLKFKNFYIPSNQMQGLYLVIKKTLKGSIKNNQKEKIEQLLNEDKNNMFKNTLKKYFGEFITSKIIETIINPKQVSFDVEFKNLRKLLLKKLLINNPLGTINYLFFDIIRRLKRIIEPTGINIALLGPDGVGKTSVSKVVLDNLSGFYRNKAYFHLKPTFRGNLKSREGSSEKLFNHNLNGNNSKMELFLSYIRLIFHFFIGYFLAFWLRVYKLKVKSFITIFDRYHYDYVIFPYSKKYFGSLKVVLNLIKILPKPDMSFYLYCNPEIIISRKNELPKSELIRQHNMTKQIANQIKNFKEINAEESIEKVAFTISLEILEYMSKRYKKRVKINKNFDGDLN